MQQEETQRTPIKIAQRPGYSIQVMEDKTYLQPTVLEGQDLSLGLIKMPDLSEALEQDGGVSYFRPTVIILYSYICFLYYYFLTPFTHQPFQLGPEHNLDCFTSPTRARTKFLAGINGSAIQHTNS